MLSLTALKSFDLDHLGSSGCAMENLFQMAEEVGVAVGSLVNIMTDDEDGQFEEENKTKNQKR